MAGLSDPGMIDLVGQDADGEVALIISHDKPWTDSEEELSRFVDKMNTYATFAMDEGLIRSFPEAAGKPLRIQIDCPTEPTPKVSDLVSTAEAKLAEYSIRVVVNLLG